MSLFSILQYICPVIIYGSRTNLFRIITCCLISLFFVWYFSGAILFPEMAMAMLEPTLPIWLLDKMHAKRWQLGDYDIKRHCLPLDCFKYWDYLLYMFNSWCGWYNILTFLKQMIILFSFCHSMLTMLNHMRLLTEGE